MTAPRLFVFFLLVALLLPAAADAQEERPFERPGIPPLTIELTPQHIGTDGTVRPVSAAEHRFADGDLVAFELFATRGGYVRLAIADEKVEDGLRVLWPEDPAGHPVAARQPTRLPPSDEPPVKLVGKGPTELLVLFALRPPDEAPTKRSWLQQIDFRPAELADAPVTGPKPIRFTGEVADGETVTMKVVLHHGEEEASDG